MLVLIQYSVLSNQNRSTSTNIETNELFLIIPCLVHSLHSARLNIERHDLDRNFSEAKKLSAMLCIFLLDK